MSWFVTLMVLACALIVDAAIGYPQVLYRKIGHPVTWIARLIAVLDLKLNNPDWSFTARRMAGVAALVALVAIPAAIASAVASVLDASVAGLIGIAVLASALLAARSLRDHVRDVATALDREGLAAGRSAVGKIVGRDTGALDAHAVSRAAIESLAENSSDGVVAPAFWFLILGLPGLVAYKAINTADSMIGHRTDRYAAFGWAAARADDIVNLPASRLTALFFVISAALVRNASPAKAIEAIRRDAGQHRSPNAGWPESAMAGALGLKLAGPRSYHGAIVDDAFMGDGKREATPQDIFSAIALAQRAWLIGIALIVTIALIISLF